MPKESFPQQSNIENKEIIPSLIEVSNESSKKIYIDNTVEFLRRFPENANLHEKDIALRKKFQDFYKSIFYKYISPELEIRLNKDMQSIKSYKTGILKGINRMTTYEVSLKRLEKDLLSAEKEIKEKSNVKNLSLENIDTFGKELISPINFLHKLYLKGVDKKEISINDENLNEEYNLMDYINLFKELKEKYSQNRGIYSTAEKRHIENAFYHIEKDKTVSHGNDERRIKNYCDIISRLREYINK